MALPISRNRTYDVGSPVRSADFNDIQDQIIRLNTKLARGTVVRPGGAAFGPGLVVQTNSEVDLNSTTDIAFFEVPVAPGHFLSAVRAVVYDNAATIVRLELFSKAGGSPLATTSSLMTSTGAGAGSLQTLSMTPNLLLAPNTLYLLRGSVNANNLCSIHRVEFDWVVA